MNGAHDMGGMHGMGPIDTDPNDPLFHAEWERRAFAITLALGFHGRWNIDAVPPCPREPASARLPQQQLFRALAEGRSSGWRSIPA